MVALGDEFRQTVRLVRAEIFVDECLVVWMRQRDDIVVEQNAALFVSDAFAIKKGTVAR